MTDLKAAAQQALEAMGYTGMDVGKFNRINAACQALRAALAEPEQEPVAWISKEKSLLSWDKFYPDMTPLYAAPPQRKRQISFEEAMRLKDQMPKGLFRNVDGQTADTIWLCAIEVCEMHHGIRKETYESA